MGSLNGRTTTCVLIAGKLTALVLDVFLKLAVRSASTLVIIPGMNHVLISKPREILLPSVGLMMFSPTSIRVK